MGPPYITGRVLLPRVEPPELGELGDRASNIHTSTSSLATSSIPGLPRSRQPKSATRTDQEWEDQKPNFLRLHVEEDLPLPEVMKRMEDEYQFKASRKQCNTKISQWRVGKNVKKNEMRAIVRKERRRKMEDPPKDSVFRVRKYPVESSKIERFKRDKGIDNDGYDRLMLGAATPSDISCDTPQPENRETLVQSTGITLESSSHDRISPVQQVISRSLYHDALSPRLQASGSFYFGHPSPSQASAAKSLDFSYSQTGCTITQSPSLTWSNLDNQSLSNSPRHSRPSPPFRRTLTSPYLPTAETALTFSSSHSSYAPLRNTTDWSMDPISTIDEPDLSKCDWFESFINYRSRSSSSTLSGSIIADLVRSFIKPVDTYQAQREYEVLRSALSVSKKNMRAEFEQGENGCGTCEALNSLSLFKRFTHTRYSRPEDLNCNVDRSWLVSETLQALLPALNRVDQIALYIARSAAQILTFEGRYQDVERIVQVIIQEMDRLSAWDHMGKEDLSLDLAEIYVFCGRYDRAQKIVQDVLKDDFPKLAMIARTKDVEFYAEADLTFFEKNSLWTWNSETTDEGVAYIKKVMGKGIAKLGVYKQAICVLNFLNRYRVVDITDVSLGRKDLTVSS